MVLGLDTAVHPSFDGNLGDEMIFGVAGCFLIWWFDADEKIQRIVSQMVVKDDDFLDTAGSWQMLHGFLDGF